MSQTAHPVGFKNKVPEANQTMGKFIISGMP